MYKYIAMSRINRWYCPSLVKKEHKTLREELAQRLLSFVIETDCVFCAVRTEAEETVQRRTPARSIAHVDISQFYLYRLYSLLT